MRTSTLLLAAISAATVYASPASPTPQSASLDEEAVPTLTPKQQLALSNIERNLEEFGHVDGYSSLMADYVKWQESYVATQTALPTDLPEDTQMDDKLMQQYAQNAIEQISGLVEVAEKKSYMKEDNQLSFVAEVEAYITLLSEVAEAQTAQATAEASATASATATASLEETTSAKETDSAKETASAKETETVSTESQTDKQTSVTSSADAEATGSAEEEEKQDEDNSAGRLSGVSALAAMLVAGLVAVVAL